MYVKTQRVYVKTYSIWQRLPFLFLSGFTGPSPSAAALAIMKHTVLNWEPLQRRVQSGLFWCKSQLFKSCVRHTLAIFVRGRCVCHVVLFATAKEMYLCDKLDFSNVHSYPNIMQFELFCKKKSCWVHTCVHINP